MSLVRRRLVSGSWTEELLLANHRDEPTEVRLAIDVAADFADLYEVKDDAVRPRQVVAESGAREVVLRYASGPVSRETHIVTSDDVSWDDGTISISFVLEARKQRTVSLRITPCTGQGAYRRPRPGSFQEQRRDRGRELAAWISQAPVLETDGETLRDVYARSLSDLAALRLHPDGREGGAVPAAGLPWFMALFGRDSLITSYQALPYLPGLARATLQALASRQGDRVDDFHDEEPGKILHEERFGELTLTGESPHSPYYGTADATPLFLVLLDEYERWTGDTDLVRVLEPNARAALAWIDDHGDADGDGYVEYEARNPGSGLVNQCWKDSPNSMLFADGRRAEGAIACCEIQGYVYDAKRRAARLAREVWGDEQLAGELDARAGELRRRFAEDFWVPGRDFFALALDGSKRRVDSLTSNIGHLLWSGIVDEERAGALAAHLMGEALFSGWGVRTMAEGETGYNPVEYHNGTVWPHDNSLIAAGLARYGYRAEAARIAGALIHAASFFEHRLPEVFAGYSDRVADVPVEFPTASSPQAWAAATPLLLLTTVTGMTPAPDGPRCDPHLPVALERVLLRKVPGRWDRADV
jgi:glycogen debranching enzyme